MFEFEVTFVVEGSGAGIVKTVVKCSSEYNARRLVESQYSGKVRIINVHRVG
jgi:hypothetical protein